MSRIRDPRRVRLRFSLEHCEPRQMLSAAPMLASPTVLVAPFDASLSNQTIINLNGTLAPGGANGFDATSRGILLNNLSAGPLLTNQFGGSTVQFDGVFAGDGVLDALFGHAIPSTWNGMPWYGIQAPVLDPIQIIEVAAPPAVKDVAAAPASPTAGQQPEASTLLVEAEPVEQNAPVGVPLVDSPASIRFAAVEMIAPAPTALRADANAAQKSDSQRWLSVSFDPVERHRLDASTADSIDVGDMASRESRRNDTLEPTRMISQTFCNVAQANSAAVGEKDSSAAARLDRQREIGDCQLRPLDQPNRAMAPAAAVDQPAIHDAAIREWHPLDDPLWQARLLNGRPLAGNSDSSSDEADPLDAVALALYENKPLVAALCAIVAVNFVWAYGDANANTPQPTAPRHPRRLSVRQAKVTR